MPLLGRDTWVTGPFPKGVLLLETLQGQEVLGRPYKFRLGLLSREPGLEPDDVLGKPLAVGIKLVTGEDRFFHGIVTDFAKTGTTHLHTRYAAELRPTLSLLDHTFDCRIFNDPAQDALAIITAVLAQRGLTDIESGAIKDHAFRKRDYCVQYRESDLRFVQRLLEEEGISYFFKHQEAKHTLVLTDSITGHEAVAGYESIPYTPEERRVAGSEEHFWHMKVRRSLYPGRHTVLSGYDPTEMRPKQPRFGRATSEELVTGYPFEHYDYPGGLFDPEEAQQEADLRGQAGCVDHDTIDVDGNTMGLGLGHLVSLRPGSAESSPFWSEEDCGNQYLVVGATYSLCIDQLETGDVAGSDEPFKARYQLLDSHTPFRPNRVTPKPRMPGRQTALVVGPAGEEIWTDKFGRVMVQFDWDRLGGRNEKSSCWMRVSQSWAGARWGAQYLPRIGQEVIVAFLDGDPDRPIITGSLYNADTMPPYELPANQTQSGIKSRSSKGGTASNFNEIRFEDKKGHEELHFQAEKDMSTLVKNNQTLSVGTDRIILVGNDETNLVKNDRQLTVDKNDSVVVGGTHDKTVTDVVTQLYGDTHSRKVDGQQEFFAEKNKDEHVKLAHKLTTDKKFQLNQAATSMTFKGSNVTVDSAGTITLQAGGATVCLDKTGKATFDSPTGIKFVVGGSSLAILPGGVAMASPAVTAAAGGAGSVVSMGEESVGMKSKTVTIEADGVCSIKGKSALKLQEAEGPKGKKGKGGPSPAADEGQVVPDSGTKPRKRAQKGEQPESATLEIHVVDMDGKSQEGLAFKIKMPDGGTAAGNLNKAGLGRAKSSSPGTFTVTFPDLDGDDWDGDGAQELPAQKRGEAARHKVQQGERLAGIAKQHGFVRWQTVLDFVGNKEIQEIVDIPGAPSIILLGIELSIPSRIEREAEVVGGTADYLVKVSAIEDDYPDFDLPPQKPISTDYALLELPPQPILLAANDDRLVASIVAEARAQNKHRGEDTSPMTSATGNYIPFRFVSHPTRPEIHHDHGFLDDGRGNIDESKRRKPTVRDYLAKAKWGLKLDGAILLMPSLSDATMAYRHFLGATGTDRVLNMEKFVRDDRAGKFLLQGMIEDTTAAALEFSDLFFLGDHYMQSGPVAVGADNPRFPYPGTENWQKAIGGFFAWVEAHVRMDSNQQRRQFTVDVTVHVEDRYNFNPGNEDIATGTPDDENGRFELCGLGKEFMNYGTLQRRLSFSASAGPVANYREKPGDHKISVSRR